MGARVHSVLVRLSLRLAVAALLSMTALLGCAASPAGPLPAQTSAASTSVADDAAVSAQATGSPRTSPPAARGAVPRVDASCKVDADCAVKDVGNCCGAYPACVNKDATTDPAAVQAACKASGRMAACGFRQIASCSCSQGTCRAESEPVGGWTDGPQTVPVK